MCWTDQKPFTVTREHLDMRWGCLPVGKAARVYLRCAMCGHRFEEGDTARWVFTNFDGDAFRHIGGNPFFCASCDGPDVLDRLRAMAAEWRACRERFWWFAKRGA